MLKKEENVRTREILITERRNKMKSTTLKRFKKVLSGVLSAACVLSGTAMAGTALLNETSVEVNAAASSTPAFSWDNATVYFLLTDRFCNGDTSNDNAYGRVKTVAGDSRATFHGGDFAGITKKINEGYFNDLGVNAIWMTAPYEQLHGYILGDGFAHYSYHGYYVTDYTEPDAAYGTRQEFQTLVDTAHEHGIRIIMDIVLNHAGYNNMIDMNEYNYGTLLSGWESVYNSGNLSEYHNKIDYKSSSSDWGRWWGPDWVRSGLPGYTNGGSDDITKTLDGLPDFKTEQTKQVGIPTFLQTKWSKEGTLDAKKAKYGTSNTVTGFISSWLADWVRTYGVDGFRCDTAKHVEYGSWKQLKDTCVAALKEWKANNPTKKLDDLPFWMTGECWDHGVGWGYDGYFTEGGFDSMINFETQGGGLIAAGNVASIYQSYADKLNSNDNFNALSYISSHDTVLARGDQYYLGSALLLLPGGVQIYYGDETCRPLVPGIAVSGDGHAVRSDMNWDSMDTAVLAHWQKVGTFRNNHLSVGGGANVQLTASAGVAFGRTYDKNGVSDKVAAVINAGSNVSVSVNVGDLWANGTALENAYDGTSAVVSGGKVTFSSGAHGTILIQEPDGQKGKVIVKHINKDNNTTIKTETLTGLVGDSYSTSPLSQEGYTVASTSGKTSGVYTESDITVTYYYTFDSSNYGYLVTKYVDAATGEELADSETVVGKVGTSYSVSPKDVKNYECDESLTTNSTGKYKAGTTTVIFKYSYVEPSNLRVHYYNANNWAAVSMYAYDESTGTAKQYTGAWPGKTMTAEGDGWFYAEVPDVESATVIFNNNNNGAQEPAGVNAPGYDLSGEVWMKNGQPITTGKVSVKYVTTDGIQLSSMTLTGIADGTTTYTTSAKTFDGYTLKTTPANATGKFTEATITVTYVYEKNGVDDPEEPLKNSSTISATSVASGAAVKLTAKASGGTSPYVYTYRYRSSGTSSWTKLGDANVTTTTKSFSISVAGTYDVQVLVKDQNGTVVGKTFTLTVGETGKLTNNSTMSATSISLGSSVKLTAKVSGGSSPYTYTYRYKKTSAASWKTLGTANVTSTTKTFKPSTSGTYDVQVLVKDSIGDVASKKFTLTVKAPSGALTNSSTISATSVTAGTSVKLTAKASGGTSPYTYTYRYRKSGTTTWKYLGSANVTSTSKTFSLSTADTYEVQVLVKDSNSTVASQAFTLTVKKGGTTLENNSTISATSTSVGSSVKLTGKASGGTSPYNYTYQFKLSTSSTWNTSGTKNGTATTAAITPDRSGTYDVRVIIKDSTGKAATKNFTLKVSG